MSVHSIHSSANLYPSASVSVPEAPPRTVSAIAVEEAPVTGNLFFNIYRNLSVAGLNTQHLSPPSVLTCGPGCQLPLQGGTVTLSSLQAFELGAVLYIWNHGIFHFGAQIAPQIGLGTQDLHLVIDGSGEVFKFAVESVHYGLRVGPSLTIEQAGRLPFFQLTPFIGFDKPLLDSIRSTQETESIARPAWVRSPNTANVRGGFESVSGLRIPDTSWRIGALIGIEARQEKPLFEFRQAATDKSDSAAWGCFLNLGLHIAASF